MTDPIARLIQRHAEEKEARLRAYMDFGFEDCESPIEVLLAAGVHALADLREIKVSVGKRTPEQIVEIGYKGEIVYLVPQVQIGAFRVDFVAYAWSPFALKFFKLVVECDGHDFHERTKEQAAKDRSRDRALQDAGYAGYRFTGSEIYRDLFKCADQVLEWAWAQIVEAGI